MPEATDSGFDDFVKQVGSFPSGTGPGPTGLRPQFFKELVGENGDDPCVEAMFRVAMLFVDGRVPRFLARFYAGGTLVGIGKDDQPLHVDARPIVVGEVWRRVACKMAL